MNGYNLAWLAGLIDGDGCISVISNRKKVNYHPYLSLVSPHRPTVDLAAQLLGGGSIEYRPWNHVYCLSVYSSKALEGIRRIEPYLFLKQNQARAVLEFPDSRGATREELVCRVASMKESHGSENLAASGTIDETSWAWLAGLFDAEGCIQLVRLPNRIGYTLRLDLKMTHQVSVYRVLHIAGTGRVYQVPTDERRKTAWNWQATTRQVGHVLPRILPYLVTKRDQAELGLRYLAVPKANRWHPPTASMLAEKEAIRQNLQEMKRC